MKFLYTASLIFCWLALFSSKLHCADLAISQSVGEPLVNALEQLEQLPTASENQEAFLQTHFPVVATTYCDALNILSPYHQDKIPGSTEVIEGIISVTSDSNEVNHYTVVTDKEGIVVGYLQNDSLQLLNSVSSSQEVPTAITHDLSSNDSATFANPPSEGMSNGHQENTSSLQNGINWCDQHPGAVIAIAGGCVMIGITVFFPAALPAAQACVNTALNLELFGCLAQALCS
ncbi:MAG: hypothetical protein K2W97_08740 [Chthoniobacterales bacterium]|nr:hypothetical protein [Chthoniobacterales bacterium]